jgi:tryptophanyl-tRNA synthetase
MTMKVTPWEVSGDIDYQKLIKNFGLKQMGALPAVLKKHYLFRRGIVYAHQDFERVAAAITKKQKFVMMTGLMPSGQMHFGHKLVADQIIFYQKLGAKVYLTVADIEAYNSRIPDMDKLRKIAIEEYLTNYVALGLDLKKCDFYFQSKRSKDGKKSNTYYTLAGTLARHATFNEFKAVYGSVDPGKITSSLIQAADMLHPQLEEFEGGPLPTVVPVGIDQSPHLRIARDISQKIKIHKFIKLSSTYHKFLPGLKGGKMSSSDETSFIALTESPKEAARKIKKYAFSGGRVSLEEHKEKGGDPIVDVSYQMLNYGLEPNDKRLRRIHDDYKSGKLLSGELKEITIKKLTDFLKEHKEKREKAKNTVRKFIKDNDI